MYLGFSPYQGSARQAYDAVLYGGENSVVSQYLRDRVDSQRELYGHNSAYYEQMRHLVDSYQNSMAQEKLRQIAVQHTQDMSDLDIGLIYEYIDEDQIRNATPTMQTYIMANPTYSQAYVQNRIDGYSDTYVNLWPGLIGTDNPVYRSVISDVTEVVVDGENDHFAHHYHYDSDATELNTLSHFEKMNILNTWDHANIILALGKTDPTDIYAGQL